METETSPKLRILIADDHLIYRLGMRTMLSTESVYDIVGEAATTTEAVSLFVEHRPDVVLLDLRMPPDGGTEVVRAVLRHNPEARILIVTSYQVEEEIFQVLRAGARGYLLKDLGREALFKAMNAVVGGELWVPPNIAAHLNDRSTRRNLTPREVDIAGFIVRGLTNAEIASVLAISESTVKNHIYSLLNKLQVADRTEAASFCLVRGIVDINTL